MVSRAALAKSSKRLEDGLVRSHSFTTPARSVVTRTFPSVEE